MTARRLLIVDDAPQVRAELRKLLPLAGDIEIVGEAPNGLDAIQKAAKLQPDVILMDLEMPLMNGYEATRQIKQQSPTCRVIVLSVHGYSEAVEKAHLSGADAFLIKGGSLVSLLQEILKKE